MKIWILHDSRECYLFWKKNTIVKRKNIEIIFWSSTKPFAFKCITQAQRTVYLFTATWQQACASGKAMKTGDADFLANRPFWCNILCILPSQSSVINLLQKSLLILRLLFLYQWQSRDLYLRIKSKLKK